MLLEKQFEIATFEKQLDDEDDRERENLWLGSIKRDNNPGRKDVMIRLRNSLGEYGKWSGFTLMANCVADLTCLDALLREHREWLSKPTARKRDLDNLHNWIEGNSCIVRAEASYLQHHYDLFSLIGPDDTLVQRMEALLTDSLVLLHKLSRNVS